MRTGSMSAEQMHRLRVHAFTKPPVTGEAFWQVAEGTGRIVPPTVFTSRLVYERAGGFDDTLRAEDFDLHLRVSRFATYHYIDEKHLSKRESPTSLGHQTHLDPRYLCRPFETQRRGCRIGSTL